MINPVARRDSIVIQRICEENNLYYPCKWFYYDKQSAKGVSFVFNKSLNII